jgi:hypothetical protein
LLGAMSLYTNGSWKVLHIAGFHKGRSDERLVIALHIMPARACVGGVFVSE